MACGMDFDRPKIDGLPHPVCLHSLRLVCSAGCKLTAVATMLSPGYARVEVPEHSARCLSTQQGA